MQKKTCPDNGVFWAANKTLIEEMLARTNVEEIWGIGEQ